MTNGVAGVMNFAVPGRILLKSLLADPLPSFNSTDDVDVLVALFTFRLPFSTLQVAPTVELFKAVTRAEKLLSQELIATLMVVKVFAPSTLMRAW